MSVFKAIKGWRELLRIVALRKAPRVQILKPNVPKATGEKDLHTLQTNRGAPKLRSKFFKSIFSRTNGLFMRPALSTLQNGGSNRMRNIPFLSLIGVGLGVDMDVLTADYTESTMSAVREIFKDFKWEPEQLKSSPQSLDDLEVNKTSVIGRGCEGAVFEAKLKNAIPMDDKSTVDDDYNLAVKAVFNYGAESNASSILRELNRETVPLQSSEQRSGVNELINNSIQRLPPHPNVVDMHCVFVDDMLVTEEGKREFPAAMPRRINPDGCFGRNKTLYLVMRKCTTRLSDFLSQDIPMRTRCLLLAQLLEAVSHINSNGIAHRDIKPDNILVDVPVNGGTPRLQVCDFGCCLAEESKSLVVPYVCSDVNLGGNSWLMAPEIACARPGEGNVLDFSKSDLWACGALAYQILGSDNPFYPNSVKQLSCKTFSQDELPPLHDTVPVSIRKLVTSMLARDPAERPSPTVAALVALMSVWEFDIDSQTTEPLKCDPMMVKSEKGSSRMPTYIEYLNKQRQKMELVLGEMFELIKKMMTSSDYTDDATASTTPKQDMIEVLNVLCLSRLTQDEFQAALKFF